MIYRIRRFSEKAYEVKFYGKDWTSSVTIFLSALVNTVLEDMTNKTPKSIMIHWNKKGGDNYIKLNIESMQTHVFHIYLDRSSSFNSISRALAHELTHLKQIVEGELSMTSQGEVLWQGELFDSKDHKHDKRKKDNSKYYDAPWEEEAYRWEDSYYNHWISSNEFKKVTTIIDSDIYHSTRGAISTYDDIYLASLEDVQQLLGLSTNLL